MIYEAGRLLNAARILFKIQARKHGTAARYLSCCLLSIIIYVCRISLRFATLCYTRNSILRLSIVGTDNEMPWLRGSTEHAAIILIED